MASWQWDYRAGPVGGAQGFFVDYALSTRIVAEFATGRRGKNPVVEYRHGEYPTPRKYVRAANLVLETVLRYTNSTGTVTHTDGAAGHVMENLGHLKRLLGGNQNTLVRLQRDAPDQGIVYIDVELLGEATPSQNRFTFTWPLHAPHPFWIGAADTANATPTWTVDGDAPIGDAVIKFTGTVTDARVTHSASGAYIEIAGALPAGGVEVDIGEGTCTKITGGADYSNYLVVNSPWWMELDPGINTVAVTQASGTPTVTADWYTQWR